MASDYTDISAATNLCHKSSVHIVETGNTYKPASQKNLALVGDSVNEWGWSPLMSAIHQGYESVVATLLSEGANIAHCNKLGVCVMSVAAARGNICILKLLLESANHEDSKRKTCCHTHISPVLTAAIHGHDEVIDLLLQYGFEGDEVLSISGTSALQFATLSLHIGVVTILLEHGANPTLLDKSGKSCINWAQLKTQTISPHLNLTNEMIQLHQLLLCNSRKKSGQLCPSYEQYTWSDSIIEAVNSGEESQLSLLLTVPWIECLPLSQRKSTLNIALGLASAKGSSNAISHLLAAGADVNNNTNNDLTPLMLAATQGHLTVCRLLLDAGADPLVRSSGHTAFEMASLSEDTSAQLLRLLAHRTLLSPLNPIATNIKQRSPTSWIFSPQPRSKKSDLLIPSNERRTVSLPGSPQYQHGVLLDSHEGLINSKTLQERDENLFNCYTNETCLPTILNRDSTMNLKCTNKVKLWLQKFSNK